MSEDLPNESELKTSETKQRIYCSNKGLYALSCVKLEHDPDYQLSPTRYAPLPEIHGLSRGALQLLDLMCYVYPTHLATHEFLVSITGKSRNTVYSYLRELHARNAIIRYSLVKAKGGRYIGEAYRPITYLVPYKYAKNKNVNKDLRATFIASRNIAKTDPKVVMGPDGIYVHEYIHTDVKDVRKVIAENLKKSKVKPAPHKGTGNKNAKGGETTNLSDVCLKSFLTASLSEVNKQAESASSEPSPGSGSEAFYRVQDVPFRKLHTQEVCRQWCGTYFLKIVKLMLSVAADGHKFDPKALPGALARCFNYRINPTRRGDLTYEKALQIKAMVDEGFTNRVGIYQLLQGYKKVMETPEYEEYIKRKVTSIVEEHACAFGQQHIHNPVHADLNGLDVCKSFVKSTLTTKEVFQNELRKRDFTSTRNYVALIEAAYTQGRTDLLEGYQVILTYSDYLSMDVNSRYWLGFESYRRWDHFEDVYGTAFESNLRVILSEERTKAHHKLSVYGISAKVINDEIDKYGSDYYPVDEIAENIPVAVLASLTINNARRAPAAFFGE